MIGNQINAPVMMLYRTSLFSNKTHVGDRDSITTTVNYSPGTRSKHNSRLPNGFISSRCTKILKSAPAFPVSMDVGERLWPGSDEYSHLNDRSVLRRLRDEV